MSLHHAGPRARPAICLDRLSTDSAGQVVYRLKQPFRDGTTHVLFSPEDFIARLAALVSRVMLPDSQDAVDGHVG